MSILSNSTTDPFDWHSTGFLFETTYFIHIQHYNSSTKVLSPKLLCTAVLLPASSSLPRTSKNLVLPPPYLHPQLYYALQMFCSTSFLIRILNCHCSILPLSSDILRTASVLFYLLPQLYYALPVFYYSTMAYYIPTICIWPAICIYLAMLLISSVVLCTTTRYIRVLPVWRPSKCFTWKKKTCDAILNVLLFFFKPNEKEITIRNYT